MQLFLRLLFVVLLMKALCFSFSPARAAVTAASIKESRGDSIRKRFVEPMKTRFEIQANYGSRNSLLVITSRGNAPAFISYANQNPTQIGVVVSFLNLSIPVSFSPSFLSNGLGLRNISFSPSTYGKWLWWNADFNYSKGYGISGFKDLSKAYLLRSTDLQALRNDIRSYALSSSLTFVPNGNRFSSAAVVSFTSRQLHSSGSLRMGLNYHFSSVLADSSLLPNNLAGAFAAEQAFVNSRSASVGIALGYTYTYVVAKNIFANITLLPSLATGIGRTIDVAEKKEKHYQFLSPSNTFGYVALGHNGQRSYWGVSLNMHTYRENPAGANLFMNFVTPTVFAGFRVVKWSRSVPPPKLKRSLSSAFVRGQKVSWWAGGSKHNGVVIEVYKKGFYKVKENDTKEEIVWEEKDLLAQ